MISNPKVGEVYVWSYDFGSFLGKVISVTPNDTFYTRLDMVSSIPNAEKRQSQMTTKEFIIWLEGFFEANEGKALSHKHKEVISKKLTAVKELPLKAEPYTGTI